MSKEVSEEVSKGVRSLISEGNFLFLFLFLLQKKFRGLVRFRGDERDRAKGTLSKFWGNMGDSGIWGHRGSNEKWKVRVKVNMR